MLGNTAAVAAENNLQRRVPLRLGPFTLDNAVVLCTASNLDRIERGRRVCFDRVAGHAAFRESADGRTVAVCINLVNHFHITNSLYLSASKYPA